MNRAAFFALPLLSCACGTAPSATTQDDAGPAEAGSPTADAGGSDAEQADAGATEAGPTCSGSPLLVYYETPGSLLQLFASVSLDGTSAPFVVDMGSGYTFVRAPVDGGAIDDAGMATISCASESLPGYPVPEFDTPDNQPVRGFVGVDQVARGAALDLRIAEKKLLVTKNPEPVQNGVVLPLHFTAENPNPYGSNTLVASHVTLDGKDSHLLLDTGSPHVLILSSVARPNETKIDTFDGNGNPVTLYTSTIQIAFNGGPPKTVLVDRAASFPSLEKTAEAINDDVVGILGLDALGNERIVITKDTVSFVP
jgi:hypothetical protein